MCRTSSGKLEAAMERERAYQQVKSGIDADRERRLLQEALERDRAFQQAR